nr:MAG TPA: hypothetical protein [Caudoviricetes sp.]
MGDAHDMRMPYFEMNLCRTGNQPVEARQR